MNHDLYKDRASRLDTVLGQGKTYWLILGKIREEFQSDRMMDGDWVNRCVDQYGFRPIYSEDGGITGRPDIVDEQKYLLCVLKYGG